MAVNCEVSVTTSMQHNPACEADSSSASQENSPHFIETEGTLPSSQQPALCSYPKKDEYSPRLILLLKILFNIILPLTPGGYNQSLPVRFPVNNPVCNSPVTHNTVFINAVNSHLIFKCVVSFESTPYLDAFAKWRKTTFSLVIFVCSSVRPSAWNISSHTGRIFMKFGI